MAAIKPLVIKTGQIQQVPATDVVVGMTEQKYLTIGNGQDELLVNTRMKAWYIGEGYSVTGWRLHEASETPIAGDCVLDVRTGATYAGSTSIAGSEKPTLTASDNNSDTTLTTWTTALTSNTFIWVNIDSVDGCKKVVFTLEMVKT